MVGIVRALAGGVVAAAAPVLAGSAAEARGVVAVAASGLAGLVAAEAGGVLAVAAPVLAGSEAGAWAAAAVDPDEEMGCWRCSCGLAVDGARMMEEAVYFCYWFEARPAAAGRHHRRDHYQSRRHDDVLNLHHYHGRHQHCHHAYQGVNEARCWS